MNVLTGSPPCMTVERAAEAIGVTLKPILLNFLKQEHLKPEFVKLNPQHTVPTINDNGYVLYESRAIIVYLQEKYGKDDSLYPKNDPKAKGIINQRLYFDAQTLFPAMAEYYYAFMFFGKPIDAEKFKAIEKPMEILNAFLEGSKYAAGEKLTLADISLTTTISVYEAVQYDLSKYPNIVRWYALCKRTVPGWEHCKASLEVLKTYYLKTYKP